MHRSELYAAFILCTLLVSPSTAIRVRATSEGTLKRILVKDQIRGGGSYIQSNPNYNDSDPNQFLPPMLGDLDKNQIRRSHQHTNNYDSNNNSNNQYSARTQRQPKPIAQVIKEFFQQLRVSSPALFYGTVSSIFVFVLWQIPQFSAILSKNFVCSQYNLSQRRYHTLFTSIISHTTLSHILMNLYGFLIFGKSIEPILKLNDMSLAAYCTLAGIFANLFFVRIRRDGSCIGLSRVTLSLLAFDAMLHPSKEIGFLIRFIPIRLPAQYALTGLLIWSVLGMMAMANGRGDGVAHATHLGGLIFGIGFHELMKRGIWKDFRRKLTFLTFKLQHNNAGKKVGRGTKRKY